MRHLEVLPMFIKRYPDGTILEFESLEKLRVFDSSYMTYSKSEILDTISNVFNIEQKDISDIQTLKEGMTNDSFLFSLNGEKYVFRAFGKETDLLINRKQESKVYEAIKSLKISDELVYLNPDNGYKISKYIKHAHSLDKTNSNEVAQAMSLIRILHESGLKVDHDFDISERINFYVRLCQEVDAVLFNDFSEVYELIK